MNNLKSYTEYAVSTPTTDFVIGFDFNYGTDAVNVTVDDVPAIEAGYSVIYLNSTTMRLSPAVPSGVVRLQRETDIDVPDNQFTAGAKFIASNMDENFTQIRHSQQEVRDGFEKLSDDTYEIIDTLQDVGQVAQDAADAAEQAAQTANDAAAQVNDKVSYQDLDDAVELAVAPVKDYIALPFQAGKSYALYERVQLANGDIVINTIAGNIVDPNVDVTGWILANDSSQIIFRRSGLSATIRTLLSKLQDVVSVMDYGAVGDGVTDDSAAINAAFNSGAGNVIFPFATYYIADEIQPKSNTVIYGCQSTIKYKDETSTLYVFDVDRVTVQDLIINGNYMNWNNDSRYTVGIYRSRDISILNCEIFNGIHAGIGVGQTDGDATPNERILIDNCHIHHIGTPDITGFEAYGNGIAVVRGNDVVIRNNNISDIHIVGAINVEGLAHDNIQIIGNRISRTTGIASGIKLYAGGLDAMANNVIIRDNILTDLSTDAHVNSEPAIWVEAGGRNVSVINNIIDGTKSSGIIIETVANVTVVGNTVRNFTKVPLRVNTASESMKVNDNVITYPAGAANNPVFIETSGGLKSIADITGNTVENAAGEAFILNARSPLRFTGNTIVNCRSNGTKGYGVTYTAASLANCIVGENIIKDTAGNVAVRFTAFYNFSGNHPDMVYLADSWDTPQDFPKFDLGVNTSFIQSSVALKASPPTTGYNARGRILYNADPVATAVTGWICTVSGTPGTWKAFGQLV